MMTILSILIGILAFQTGLAIYHVIFRKDMGKLVYTLRMLNIKYKKYKSFFFEDTTIIELEPNKYFDKTMYYFDQQGNIKNVI